jgi:hypothetical protein
MACRLLNSKAAHIAIEISVSSARSPSQAWNTSAALQKSSMPFWNNIWVEASSASAATQAACRRCG